MKQAIILMVYSYEQNLFKILKNLDFNLFDIFIHVDKKAKDFNFSLINNVCKQSTVRIYSIVDVRRGHYSQIECEMVMLQKVIEHGPYKYIHFLSGEDWPIKKSKDIFDFFI